MSALNHSIQPQCLLVHRFLYCELVDWFGIFFLVATITLILSQENVMVVVSESIAVAQDICFLTVFLIRNLSAIYKYIISKESLMFPEFLGLQDFSAPVIISSSTWLWVENNKMHNSLLPMISFCGVTLLNKHFYLSSQCSRHNSILFASFSIFSQKDSKENLYSHFLIFIPLCTCSMTFLTTS